MTNLIVLVALLLASPTQASVSDNLPKDAEVFSLYYAIDILPEDTEFAGQYKQYQKDKFSTDYKVGWEKFTTQRN